ncbi:hypothetical protein B296_00030952 [Ensete ventricosum]|uniref:Secreted protein n=1 Tax=Ensete ventricosum TaxID=4639 RepID=A0A426ZME5_ENSVE|nr:hypothetical protein B296_00030952 [Ensete ventricosum]
MQHHCVRWLQQQHYCITATVVLLVTTVQAATMHGSCTRTTCRLRQHCCRVTVMREQQSGVGNSHTSRPGASNKRWLRAEATLPARRWPPTATSDNSGRGSATLAIMEVLAYDRGQWPHKQRP